MRCDVTIATGSLRMRLPRLRWASFLSSYQSIFLSFSLSLSLSLLSTSQWHWLVDRCLRISCQVPSKYTSHYKHMAGWTRTKWFQFNKIAHIWSRWHFIGHRFQRWSQGRIKVRGPIRPFCLALEKKRWKWKDLGRVCVCVCVIIWSRSRSFWLGPVAADCCGTIQVHPANRFERWHSGHWLMADGPTPLRFHLDPSLLRPRRRRSDETNTTAAAPTVRPTAKRWPRHWVPLGSAPVSPAYPSGSF